MIIKQLGQRYRVRQDPYFHGFWCVVDRYWLRDGATWSTALIGGVLDHHFREADDALQMVKLLEISDKVNKGE